MTPAQRLEQLMRDVGHDVRDYRLLASLLEQQFATAMRHDTAALQELTPRITGLVDTLGQRRARRVTLVESLAGAGAQMTAAIALLRGARQDVLQAGWDALEELVRQCKALNLRNCRLMTDQHDLMQRVLYGEVDTYAPA